MNRQASDSYVVKWQNRGGQPHKQPFATESKADGYAKTLLSMAKKPVYLAIEHYENDVLVDTKILKGTASPAEKKLTKLRADLEKLEKLQERAVGGLNKAEFDADIEWTKEEIARQEARR